MIVAVLLGLIVLSAALPVTKTEKKADEKEAEHGVKYDEGYGEEDPRNRPDVSHRVLFIIPTAVYSFPSLPPFQLQLEYSKYLQEVVSALENDPEFRAKLDKADETDIRVSKIWLER